MHAIPFPDIVEVQEPNGDHCPDKSAQSMNPDALLLWFLTLISTLRSKDMRVRYPVTTR